MSEAPPLDLSVLLPTRGRPARVRRLLDSLAESAARPDRLEVVLRVDADDVASQQLCHARVATVPIVGPPGEPMGRMFRACYEASHGRILMLMNDDVVFRTHGWDVAVLDAFGRFPDGVALVWGNDLDQRWRLPTFPIFSRTVAELLGGVCPEEYRHFHIESHLHDVFRRLAAGGYERRVYLDGVVFEHEHYVVGKAARDATYRHDDHLGPDEQLYFELTAHRRHCAAALRAHIEYARATRAGDARTRLDRSPDRPRTVSVLSVGDWPTTTSAAGRMWEPMPGTVIRVAGVPAGLAFPRMANAAIRRADGDVVAFVPEGAVPGPGWPRSAQEVLDGDEKVAACGVRVVDPSKRQLLHAGMAFVEAGGASRCVPLYRGLPADHPVARRRRRLQAVGWAGLVARRTALVEVGGFDEALGSEILAVIDLCLRLGQMGWLIEYMPDAVLYWDRPLEPEGEAATGVRASEVWCGRARSDLEDILRQDGVQEERAGADLAVRRPFT